MNPNQELVVSKEDQLSLSSKSMSELSELYSQVSQQSVIMTGLIALCARERADIEYKDRGFDNPDHCYGEWVSANFADTPIKTLNEKASLAKFFKEKPMGDIKPSVGYMISAPKNEEIADQIYEKIININNGNVTIREAKEIISDLGGSISDMPANYSSESEDWYTPEHYMNTVRAFFDGIDLDPCSCDKANESVQADTIYTKEEDSLTKDWYGRVFMNPPYGKDGTESVAGIFCNKAIEEYKNGNAEEVIILVNSSHTQKWQQPLYDYSVCFVDHRIKFVAGDGSENNNPTFGNIFVYLGERKQEFAKHFSEHGYVMEKIN